MSEAKHTPGPWKVEFHGKAAYVMIYKPLGLPRETGWATFAPQPYSHPPEATANAHLIAAAPDMLAALENLRKELRAHIKLDVKKHYSLMVADAAAGTAIHKATGAS